APFLEIRNFVLPLADDDLDDGLIEPSRLRCELGGLGLPAVARGALRRATHSFGFRLPERDDALVHACTRDLVYTDQQHLARLPARRTVLDEISGDLV